MVDPDIKKRDRTIREATELLKRANEILDYVFETRALELMLKVDKEAIYPVYG